MTPTPQQLAEASKVIAENVPGLALKPYSRKMRCGGTEDGWEVVDPTSTNFDRYIVAGTRTPWTLDSLRVAWGELAKDPYGMEWLAEMVTQCADPSVELFLHVLVEKPIDSLVIATAEAFLKVKGSRP